jgi:MFS family permease
MQNLTSKKQLKKRPLWFMVLAIGLGILTTSFDSSAVVTILPIISNAFHSNAYTAKWVITSYLLTVSPLLLIAGQLGDMLGHRRLYLTGLTISFAGALLCARASSISMLVLFRIVEGLGTVLVLANAAALITKLSAANRRGRMLGFLSSMAYIGIIMGPLLSGLLSGVFGWRSIFIVVALFVTAAFILGAYSLPSECRDKTIRHLNILPTVLIALALGSIVLAFHLSDRMGWQSLPILSLVIAAFIAIMIVVRRGTINVDARQHSYLIFNRPFVFAAGTAMFCYMALYSVILVLPFFFFSRHAFNPVKIGLILSIRPAVTALLAPVGGIFSDRNDTRMVSASGLFILLLALTAFTVWDGQSQMTGMIISLAGIGAGMGIFLPANHRLIMSAVSPEKIGMASAILSLTRNIGMLIGASLGGTFILAPTVNRVNVVFYISAGIVGSMVLNKAINSVAGFMKHRNVLSP